MKKTLLLLFLATSFFARGQTPESIMKTQANTIKNEVSVNANTANRVGTNLLAIINSKTGRVEPILAGGVNTYTVSIDWFTGYSVGLNIRVQFANANTGAATLNISGFGAKSLTKAVSGALVTGDILAGETKDLWYDGTNFQVLNISSGGGGGASLPFNDNVSLLQNQADNTKQARFDLSGIATGTTRVYRAPNLSGKLLLSANSGSPFLTNVFDDYTIFNTAVGVSFDGINNFSGELSFSGSSGTVNSTLNANSTIGISSDDSSISGSRYPFLEFNGKNLRLGTSSSGTPNVFFHSYSDGLGIDEGVRFIFNDNRAAKYGIEYAANGYVTNNQSLADKQYVDGRVANAANITSGILPVARGGTNRGSLGSALQVLRVNAGGTDTEWSTPAAGFIDPMTTRGDIIFRNSSNVTARLGRGTANQLLISDGTDIAWTSLTASNGITKTANNFALGGTLSGAVLVNGGSQSLDFGSGGSQLSSFGINTSGTAAMQGTEISQTVGTGGFSLTANSGGGISFSTTAASSISLSTNSLSRVNISSSGRTSFGTGDNVGIAVSTHTADHTTPINGVVFYNSTSNLFRFRQNGAWVGLGIADPMTTRGDIIVRNSSNVTARLPIGTGTYVLTSDGTDVNWAAPSGGGSGLTYAQSKALKFK